MSGLAKILTGVAAAGGIVSAIFAFLIVGAKSDAVKERDSINQQLVQTKTKLTESEKQLSDTTAKLTENQAKLDETSGKVSGLESQLETAQKKASDLENTVKDVEAQLSKAKGDLDKITEALGEDSPEDLRTKSQAAVEKVSALEAEQRIIQDQLQAEKARVAQLEDSLRRRDEGGKMPPGVSGKVETVNRMWNFVVLNVGDKDGVVPNGLLIVYRGNNFIGKVRVVSTEAHTSVADILPEWSNADIRPGDSVLN